MRDQLRRQSHHITDELRPPQVASRAAFRADSPRRAAAAIRMLTFADPSRNTSLSFRDHRSWFYPIPTCLRPAERELKVSRHFLRGSLGSTMV